MFIDLRESGREKHQRERETLISCLLYVPGVVIEPTIQAHASTGNRIANLAGVGQCPNQPSHTGQGEFYNNLNHHVLHS